MAEAREPGGEAPVRMVRQILAYDDVANPWLRVFFDEVTVAGAGGSEPRRYNRVVEGSPDAGPPVVVVPVLPDGRLVFVHTYRYPIGRWSTELPRGFGEPGASAIEQAQRELLEETGLGSETAEEMGTIYPNSGLLATAVRVVRVRARPGYVAPQLEEAIDRVIALTDTEIDEGVRRGEIADAISLGALFLHRAR